MNAKLSKRCPVCKNVITKSKLREYRREGELQCPNCCKTLAVKFTNSLMASVIFGTAVGVALGLPLALFTNLDSDELVFFVVVTCIFAGLLLDGYVELALFELSVKDDNPYF